MSVIPIQQPPLEGGQVPVDPAMVTQDLLRAAQQAARGALSAQGADCKDFGAAALSFAQAIVVLDPSLSQGGTPLQHDLALKAMEGQTQENIARIQGEHAVLTEQVRGDNQLRQAKETAAAPSPAKQIQGGPGKQ